MGELPTMDGLEWIGSLAGIAGAWMMAVNSRISPWAYPVWILASAAMLAFAWRGHHLGLALQQAVFCAINLVGLYRWLVNPPPVVGQLLDERG